MKKPSIIAGSFYLALTTIVISCIGLDRHPEDDVIDQAVKRTIYDYEPVNFLQVEISTTDRIVYLSGEVETFPHKEEAERLAKRVDGVRAVVNKIQVLP
jgi:osmotically-inducible protein OsmY